MVNAALVGCGDVAAVHVEAIEALSEELGISLVGVADTHLDAAKLISSKTTANAYPSLTSMLDKEEIDVLHITTPHDQHIDLAIEALEAGVNVILEKPLAHETEYAYQLLDYLEEHPGAPKIGVCYQNRYNVSSLELRRLLDSGTLGTVHGVYASVVWTRTPGYYTAKPWRGQKERAGGGLLMNQAIHTLDLLQWFMGPVTGVKGMISTDKYGDVVDTEDTAHAYLRHESGVHTSFYGTLTNSRHRHVEIEIDCAKALVELRDGLTVTWKDGQVDHYEERKQESEGRSYWGVSHELLIRDFYERLADPEPFWIGPAEAMSSLGIAKAIYQSSQEKE
ncbi:Gfo/Idh/MocA family protein [Corynebacterium pilosum]|uniref:Predicted dehydrogenase n=1 Tax=Corynebacterium pilosum TaxID=35756 RepID=A0A376CP10_9CORY|nr:Gfo/Idh/MocA family oxidoreductase [Corynebacterium pilosum]STC70063.1 predicted dehydrogenase [Corynebacterium pilosum]